MIEAIVYCSNTGFTKQYAYSFAVRTGLPIYSLKESKSLKDNTNIIYFSWIKNNGIVSLDKANRFNVVKVCAVGLNPYSTEQIDVLKATNSLDDIYYLQGGLRMYKLSIFDRATINKLAKYLKKKDDITTDEKLILEIINNGCELIDLDSLNILVDWYMNEMESIVC